MAFITPPGRRTRPTHLHSHVPASCSVDDTFRPGGIDGLAYAPHVLTVALRCESDFTVSAPHSAHRHTDKTHTLTAPLHCTAAHAQQHLFTRRARSPLPVQSAISDHWTSENRDWSRRPSLCAASCRPPASPLRRWRMKTRMRSSTYSWAQMRCFASWCCHSPCGSHIESRRSAAADETRR